MDSLLNFGSHFHRPSNTVFTLGECEKCGGEVMEPNSVTILNLQDLNVKELIEYKETYLPWEIFWNDDFGGAVCESCDG